MLTRHRHFGPLADPSTALLYVVISKIFFKTNRDVSKEFIFSSKWASRVAFKPETF